MTDIAAPPIGEPAIRITAMPADTNPDGDIFGGWLLAHMDLAAASVASSHSGGRAATIALDSMSFLRPVKVGDEVSVHADLLTTGRSSMRVAVEAWRRPRGSRQREQVTKAIFTFVAINEHGRPRPVAAKVG
jgi:acyl-CoA thioesterase YciA